MARSYGLGWDDEVILQSVGAASSALAAGIVEKIVRQVPGADKLSQYMPIVVGLGTGTLAGVVREKYVSHGTANQILKGVQIGSAATAMKPVVDKVLGMVPGLQSLVGPSYYQYADVTPIMGTPFIEDPRLLLPARVTEI